MEKSSTGARRLGSNSNGSFMAAKGKLLESDRTGTNHRNRPRAQSSVAPRRTAGLAGVFATGAIAHAWLAAYAEELAFRFELSYPDWIWEPERFLNLPYIHDAHSPRLKVWHTLKSRPSFSRRNLFVDFQLPLIQLRPGRPRKSAAHKREMNRRRVARHRARNPNA